MDQNTTFDSKDFRSAVPRLSAEKLKASQVFADLLKLAAQRKNATPDQIAFAWLLARKSWIVPIPGTTKMHRLIGNPGATAVELISGELLEMNTASSEIKVQGDRYSEGSAKLINR